MSTCQNLLNALRSADFSGVVRVASGDRDLVSHAAGRTRSESGLPISSATRFATASVTKMFTAACLARLVEAGRCEFGQPIAMHVPDARRFGDEVTIDRLLSHTAGLGDYLDDDASLPFAGLPVEQLTCVEAFLPYVLKVARHPVGAFRYSSAGYILLGLAIEAITQQPYVDAVHDWVLGPAGLRSTGFTRVDDPSPDFAWGYLPDAEPNIGHLPPVGGPDGGIVTTADDLQRFFDWLKSADALTDAMRDQLWTKLSGTGDGDGYGRGFDVMRIAGRTWVGHTGSDPGVSARVAFDPASDASIIVLCNRSSIAFRAFRLIRAWVDEQGWPPSKPLVLTGED